MPGLQFLLRRRRTRKNSSYYDLQSAPSLVAKESLFIKKLFKSPEKEVTLFGRR